MPLSFDPMLVDLQGLYLLFEVRNGGVEQGWILLVVRIDFD